MSIRWIGVPKSARKAVRAELKKLPGSDFLVCSEKGRIQEVRKHIRESLWAFNSEFIAQHTRGKLEKAAIKALKEVQVKLCESANELIFSMLKSFKKFCHDATTADGFGHHLSPYDGEENVIQVEGEVLDRLATDHDRQTRRIVYVYRTN